MVFAGNIFNHNLGNCLFSVEENLSFICIGNPEFTFFGFLSKREAYACTRTGHSGFCNIYAVSIQKLVGNRSIGISISLVVIAVAAPGSFNAGHFTDGSHKFSRFLAISESVSCTVSKSYIRNKGSYAVFYGIYLDWIGNFDIAHIVIEGQSSFQFCSGNILVIEGKSNDGITFLLSGKICGNFSSRYNDIHRGYRKFFTGNTVCDFDGYGCFTGSHRGYHTLVVYGCYLRIGRNPFCSVQTGRPVCYTVEIKIKVSFAFLKEIGIKGIILGCTKYNFHGRNIADSDDNALGSISTAVSNT